MDAGQLSQALVGLAAIAISLFTFMSASNDRRHKAEHDELEELRGRLKVITEERDDYQRKYFNVLEENSTLRRGNV